MNYSDRHLVREYLNGKESAFEILLYRHKDRIYSHIIYMVKDEKVAEDIFQDTFIKIMNTLKKGKYNEEGKFLPWAMKIAHNLVIDHFRKTKKMKMVHPNEEFDIFDVIKQNDKNVEEGLEVDQDRGDVRKYIRQLPFEQKEVVIMRHYMKMSFKEIACKTQVSINTALGRMRYGLINMKKIMEEKEENEVEEIS